MTEFDYRPFDCDNHYYEAEDAFTRHLDPAWGPRTVMWCNIGKRRYHVVGGKISFAVMNPTFNPIAKAGAMFDFFRGNPDRKEPMAFLQEREPIRPEYRNRDARLKVMDQQGIDACWMFPTLGVLYEEALKRDTEATTVTFRAFNRWLNEDWGLCYQDRIMGAPYIPMVDPAFAAGELAWALQNGARVICLRPAAAHTASGPVSPADPLFDSFWGLANEAGITVVVHASDSGYSGNGYVKEGFSASVRENQGRPTVTTFGFERAACDFLITMVFDKLFERFPNLRLASVENGAEFLPGMLKKVATNACRFPSYFKEDPVDLFKQHVWINPFWEDSSTELVEIMGSDRVLFGSDWPHIEGMPEPLDYLTELQGMDDKARRNILRDNTLALNERRPV